MKKATWQSVFDEHVEWMSVMVTVAYNQYRGCTNKEGLNIDMWGNSKGSFLLANLIDKDDLVVTAGTCFHKAYKTWDGKRPFKAWYRQVFMNAVSNIARKERTHRLREVTMSVWRDMDGNDKIDALDERTYMIPVMAVDFADFIETLPELHRVMVDAVLNASEVLGIVGNPRPNDVLGALRRYAKKVGIPIRAYWKITNELYFMLEERMYG